MDDPWDMHCGVCVCVFKLQSIADSCALQLPNALLLHYVQSQHNVDDIVLNEYLLYDVKLLYYLIYNQSKINYSRYTANL